MGLLDYYKQFEAMSDEEQSENLKRRSAEQKRKALERVAPLDLSQTTWPEFPHPDVVAAITFAARRGMNRYADLDAAPLRAELARRTGIEAERIAVGNGAAELLEATAWTLMEPGDELVTPWPSYPLYPLMAKRAHAQAVPVPGHDHDHLLGAISGHTRMVVLCNPNDPTGHYTPVAELQRLAAELPERVVLCIDEALIDYADAEPVNRSLELLDEHPRTLIFRSFSKAYGLAGLRVGYVLGGTGSEQLLEQIAPALGVSAPGQAGALEALRKTVRQVGKRRDAVIAERARLLGELAGTPIDAEPSQGNFLWMTVTGMEGAELARRLEQRGVIVAPGGAFGATDHVRATVIGSQATDRLLMALAAVVV